MTQGYSPTRPAAAGTAASATPTDRRPTPSPPRTPAPHRPARLPSPAPEWLLVSESDASIPARANLQPGIVAAEVNIVFLQATTSAHVGLVGVLRGDVDGSFAGLPGATDLDQSQPTYITDLIARLGLQASQFGVYGV